MAGNQAKDQSPQEVITSAVRTLLQAVQTYEDLAEVEAGIRTMLAARKSQLWSERQARVQEARAAERRASREAVRVAELAADAVAAPYAVKP